MMNSLSKMLYSATYILCMTFLTNKVKNVSQILKYEHAHDVSDLV